MGSADKLTPTSRLVFGALLVGFACIPILGYFDMGPVRHEDINGPAWLVLVVGGVLVAAAVAVVAGQKFPWLNQFMGLSILIGFAAIGHWIAFGSGERACSGGFSLGGLGGEGGVSDLECRIAFGLGAVIVDALIFWGVVSMLQKMRGGPPAFARTKSVAEHLILLSLSPFIILALLLIVIPAGVKAVYTRVTSGHWPRNESFIRKQARKLNRRPASSDDSRAG